MASERQCERPGCTNKFTPKRSTGKYCSPSCRVRASQTRGKLVAISTPPMPAASEADPPVAGPGILSATREELQKAGALDTALGQVALQLAAKLQYVPETGSGTAALSRELRQVLDAALGRAGNGGDALDEIGKRRQTKYNAVRA